MINKRWGVILALVVLAILTATAAFAHDYDRDDYDRDDYDRDDYDRDDYDRDDYDRDDYDRDDYGKYRSMRRPNSFGTWQAGPPLSGNTETFQGSFTLVDETYPAMVSDEGDTWYLIFHFPVDGSTGASMNPNAKDTEYPMFYFSMDENELLKEGADLKIQALRAPMSPVHLMVVEIEVDGVKIEAQWPEDWGRMKPGRGKIRR